MRILLPCRSPCASSRSTSRTTREEFAIFALPSSTLGSITTTPMARRVSRFLMTAWWQYMASCIAGTTMTGLRLPRAVVANVVTDVSSIPHAILPMVLAVAGTIISKSAFPPTPQNSTCSTRPVISVITGFWLAYSRAFGCSIWRAAGLMTQCTTAPRRIRSRTRSTVRTAAMLPVTPTTILFPDSVSLTVPKMSEGMIVQGI
ncbi:Uncharacterised protein [uncultured archaeon]|nr:Uncharacterised protein [uncultured archaeon]